MLQIKILECDDTGMKYVVIVFYNEAKSNISFETKNDAVTQEVSETSYIHTITTTVNHNGLSKFPLQDMPWTIKLIS